MDHVDIAHTDKDTVFFFIHLKKTFSPRFPKDNLWLIITSAFPLWQNHLIL